MLSKNHQRKRNWYLKNRDRVLDRQRHSCLSGKWTGLTKRPYPGTCEVCNIDIERPHYHHWDDTNPSLGLWLCPMCHRKAEGMDAVLAEPELFELYQAVKDNASSEYFNSRLL